MASPTLSAVSPPAGKTGRRAARTIAAHYAQSAVFPVPPALMDTFWWVFAEMHNAIDAWRQNRLRAPDYEVHGLNATAAHIPSAAEAVYHQLPDDVQALLTSDDYGTIFLAPCGETVHLPWELVRVPECRGGKGGWTYVGLRRLLPRIQGLGALREVLMRQPQHGDGTTGEPGDQAPRTRGRRRTGEHGRTKRAVTVGQSLGTSGVDVPPWSHQVRARFWEENRVYLV